MLEDGLRFHPVVFAGAGHSDLTRSRSMGVGFRGSPAHRV